MSATIMLHAAHQEIVRYLLERMRKRYPKGKATDKQWQRLTAQVCKRAGYPNAVKLRRDEKGRPQIVMEHPGVLIMMAAAIASMRREDLRKLCPIYANGWGSPERSVSRSSRGKTHKKPTKKT